MKMKPTLVFLLLSLTGNLPPVVGIPTLTENAHSISPNAAPGPLRLAAAQTTIEHTPLILAFTDSYPSTYSVQNGGVADIIRGRTIDLAANAETQILRRYQANKSLRLIAVVVEATYHLVVNNSSGTIRTPASLRGKKIATSSGSSSGYFVERFLSLQGNLSRNEYTVVSNGGSCTRLPCGDGTYPGMLARGTVDAVGMWEPLGELSVQTLGREKAAVLGDKKIYREIYSLCTMKEKLDDPERRASIVAFVRGMIKTQEIFTKEPEKVLKRVSGLISVSEEILKSVWEDHAWNAELPGDLLDFLVEEDKYVARIDSRAAMSRDVISGLIDTSVLKEAMA